jgi:hypothetical protein
MFHFSGRTGPSKKSAHHLPKEAKPSRRGVSLIKPTACFRPEKAALHSSADFFVPKKDIKDWPWRKLQE